MPTIKCCEVRIETKGEQFGKNVWNTTTRKHNNMHNIHLMLNIFC